MPSWRPSIWARIFDGTSRWVLTIDDEVVTVDRRAETLHLDLLSVRLSLDSAARTIVVEDSNGSKILLRGVPRGRVHEVGAAIVGALGSRRRKQTAVEIASAEGAAALAWWMRVTSMLDSNRWADHDSVARLDGDRPSVDQWIEVASDASLHRYFFPRSEQEQEAVGQVREAELPGLFAERNERWLLHESRVLAPFFRTVEKSPLTEEQTRAVVCFDNRVRVIASAGSGKTSTMVARAGYAIGRKIADPSEVLALAFNHKAAGELSDRMKSRLGSAGADVTSSTFHAFGLRIIGQATDRKATVPDVVVKDNGVRRLDEVVDACRDRDASFRRDWDLFRLVFGRPLRKLEDDEAPETVDSLTRHDEFRTLAGEDVRSREEVMIANWLFINGVRYEYERPYAHDVADAHHRQYQPDFYYPDIDVWHEHWAIGANGKAPPHFNGYEASMAWRRATHERHGTSLIETTSATVRDGSAFEHLRRELESRGVVLEENPYREAVGEPPISDRHLKQLLRTFMGHAKGNRLGVEELRSGAGRSLRSRLFLRLYATVVDEWDRRLREQGQIDFEDMLNLATDHVTSGRWRNPYRLIMVDEMQDTSVARAALVRALMATQGTFLYAVGDDWQSVNRFAGADLSVMKDFDARFGIASTVYLSRTFRSPQELCDIAGGFVMKNPRQIEKQVQSSAVSDGAAVTVISVRQRSDYDKVALAKLQEIDRSLRGPATVLLLGRYRTGIDDVEQTLKQRYRNLRVEYNTVHESKGKEADYVLIVGVERRAFPSTIEDDPVLQVAMADPDPYPFAEERRLFYVALTRARRQAVILTRVPRESPFILELARDDRVAFRTADGTDMSARVCPLCGRRLVKRTGPKSEFFGCAGFPACTHTANDRKANGSRYRPAKPRRPRPKGGS